ncbi:M23 family metallopeptidase [Sphingomonas sp.]|uniref:M23 family metallopeptidase n=1 Tax=Sphingomonas sp. TaxID=28214 RepID=UPI0025FB0128|nr:M23 family metallopeptidase [Sphingomonas sp.]MBV9527429.1 M23 family metallopeptidase [Sphingomonas sp.]
MNAISTQGFALARAPYARPARTLNGWLLLGGAALALLAITAVAALPSATSPLHAQPVPQSALPPPPRYIGAATDPAPRVAAVDENTRRFSGLVGSDLTTSLEAAGVPAAQGRDYVAVLARAIRLQDGLSVDDRFDLVVERQPDGTLGQLLYVGLDRVARADVELLKWTDGKHMIWVNGDGVGGETQGALHLPVAGRVTSGFGERFHPILGYERFHAGVDLGAALGSPIAAAADGRVVSAGWRGGYGRAVEIVHASGLETLYGHMSRIAAAPGELVHQGEVIGYVGSSGLSTGPHVHFEVLRNGRPVNPMAVKLDGGPGQLQGEKLHQFDDTLRAVLTGSAG